MKRNLALSFAAVFFAFCAFAADSINEQLLNAAKKGQPDTVRTLLDKGADVNTKTRYGVTPLMYAAQEGHLEVARVLIDRGADVNAKDTFYNSTVLEAASYGNHFDVVKLLLEKDAGGALEALTGAIYEGNPELAKVVLENAKLEAATLNESLQLATFNDQKEIVALLKKKGAKIQAIEEASVRPFLGNFRNEEGNEISLAVKNNTLFANSSGQDIAMFALEANKYKPAGFSAFTVELKQAEGKPVLFVERQDGTTSTYSRMEQPASAAPESETPPVSAPAPKPATPTAQSRKPATKTAATNWPSFRGWSANGAGDGLNPPTTWDVEKGVNIRWKTEIPGLANSSPVVWGDRIFVTTAISSETNDLKHGLYGDVKPLGDLSPHTWKVYALNKNTGKIIWEQTALQAKPNVKRHPKSTQANATPATDGKRLVVLFGTGNMYAYDLDGKLLWQTDLGVLDAGWFYDPDYQWAHGSSPIIYKDFVIVQCDRQKDSYIAAYDIRNGKQVWRTAREEIPSWGSPTVYEGNGRAEIITNGTNFVRAYDASNGKELWRISGNSEITIPTPVVNDDVIYVTSGYRPVQPIYAIRPGASGDISLQGEQEKNEHILWSKKRGGPYIPTPIIYGDYLYTCGHNGVLTCYNAKTGEQLYQNRLGGRGSAYAFTASPVAADGKLYFFSEDGEVFVVKEGPSFELLAKNVMTEPVLASPALTDRMIVIRTLKNVYGISEEK